MRKTLISVISILHFSLCTSCSPEVTSGSFLSDECERSCEEGFECQETQTGSPECVRVEDQDMDAGADDARDLGDRFPDTGVDTPDSDVDMSAEVDMSAGGSPGATCEDGLANGDETGVDCGGSCPESCQEPDECIERDDCPTGECVDGQCISDLCADGEHNGSEGDIDCGGDCEPCESGMSCQAASDCGDFHYDAVVFSEPARIVGEVRKGEGFH